MSDDNRARRYARLQFLLAAASLGLTAAFLLVALAGGGARTLSDRVAEATSIPALQVALVAAVLGVLYAVLAFPLAWVQGYWLPRRYGLLHQRLGGWLRDRAKAGAIGGILTLGGVEVIYALLRTTAWWWVAAAAIFFVVYVLMAALFPVWLLPLFYRLTPLDDVPLRERLLGLADRARVPVVGVWVADQSRRSRTANAALTGLGRTRRIILFDTLVREFPPDEVESVLAHELGHHVHGDVRRGLLAQGLFTLVTFALADLALRAGVSWWGLADVADPAGLPWLSLVLVGVGLLAAPAANGLSRWMERQADDFALAITEDPRAFIAAMERLATLNLAERKPSRLKEIVFYSHPAIERRIARARDREGARSARSAIGVT
ncbi:MAG TPA: M48 family metallopeptidase [Methylomirabilota bacterium]